MKLAEIFTSIMGCLPARRGQLFKQHYIRTDAAGNARQLGPYYVLTRSIKGKTVSERINQADVARVQADLDRGKSLSELIENLWQMAERAAEDQADPKKKLRSGRSKRRH